jgi:hypothetical protein
MQKESAQYDHPVWKKCSNFGLNLLFWGIVKIPKYFGSGRTGDLFEMIPVALIQVS